MEPSEYQAVIAQYQQWLAETQLQVATLAARNQALEDKLKNREVMDELDKAFEPGDPNAPKADA